MGILTTFFPIRPIVSSIGTTTYKLSKYLAKMLVPLRKSQYSLTSANDFMNKIQTEKTPNDYRMVSVDMKILFTNVPLDSRIDVILQRIFDNHEIQATISRV